MSGKLLLPSARSGVLLESPQPHVSPWWRRITVAIGVVTVVVGAADVFTRVASFISETDLSFTAFAPGALIIDPALQGLVEGARTEGIVPAKLIVPSLGIEAAVEHVGKKADGSMDTPKTIANVAWYEPGSMPGEQGNAVFAGHVNNALGMAGVFKELSALRQGDTVEVVGEGGERYRYEVERVAEYHLTNAPLEEIFAKTGPSRAVLITCEGTWDKEARTYDKRLVVVARLLNP
jgi:LPXTG-site transpeptidase (sortase) family protein